MGTCLHKLITYYYEAKTTPYASFKSLDMLVQFTELI